jgi:hypothetical protein
LINKKCQGPLVSLRCRLNGARSLPSHSHASCRATHRRPEHCCGHRPRTSPRAPYPFARDCSGEAPSYLDSSSRLLAASTPLPLTAFFGREGLPDASPLHPTPGLVFTSPSTTVPWGTLPTSPSSPMSAPPTPHQSPTFCRAHRRHKPTPVCLPPSETPNWVPPPLEHVSRQLPLRPWLSTDRILPARHRHQGGEETPLLRPRAERPRGLGWEGCGQVGLAHSFYFIFFIRK